MMSTRKLRGLLCGVVLAALTPSFAASAQPVPDRGDESAGAAASGYDDGNLYVVDGGANARNNLGSIQAIRNLRSRSDEVEIEVIGDPFPVTDDIPVLTIGGRSFFESRYPEDGSIDTLIFTVPSNALANARAHDRVRVAYSGMVWDVGTLNQ